MDYERFWRRLQGLGLNAYEARTYLVLVGHPRFKALELANRASVPRQKIYEVLDSLVEKGFAHVIQEKTKLFSAVEPGLAVPNYLARRRQILERDLTEQSRLAAAIVDDLNSAYSRGQEGRGTLDYLRIISEPGQAGAQFREMLAEVREEYLEFSRPPYAGQPLESDLVIEAARIGVKCRILVEPAFLAALDETGRAACQALGVEVRLLERLPMKLAIFDGTRGMIALLDPVVTKPTWTSVVFDHVGMGQAMKGLFDDYWKRATLMESPAMAVKSS
jgi:HTH-type transcriptional regulator, sugar sensing transcriptional regulator